MRHIGAAEATLRGLCLCVLAWGCAASPLVAAERKLPVILDTDIGDDIDDTWALALLLKSPELDLKLVTTDYSNALYRARIAAKLLEVAGRTDVGVGLGLGKSDNGGRQAAWVKDYDLAKYPGKVFQDGVQALIDTIMQSSEPITLICIGPVPSVAAALAQEPRIAERARFVGMHGSLRRGYGGREKDTAEWNVRADAKACRQALSAPWPKTITPLDTCGLVHLRGEKYTAVRNASDPLTRALLENYRIWSGKHPERADRESSTLYDTVAIYLAFSRDLVTIEDLKIVVTDDGHTRIDSAGVTIGCAVEWKDLPAFEDLLVKRLAGK